MRFPAFPPGCEPIDHSTQPIGHDRKHRADPGEKKNRRDSKLDRMGNSDIREFKHETLPPNVSLS
jgi:hypothetical protein